MSDVHGITVPYLLLCNGSYGRLSSSHNKIFYHTSVLQVGEIYIYLYTYFFHSGYHCMLMFSREAEPCYVKKAVCKAGKRVSETMCQNITRVGKKIAPIFLVTVAVISSFGRAAVWSWPHTVLLCRIFEAFNALFQQRLRCDCGCSSLRAGCQVIGGMHYQCFYAWN